MRPLGEDKKGHVGGGGDEAELTKEGREPLVPSSRGLLQSVQGLLQEADVICSGGVDETWWLLAVDRLVEVAVKKGILHVQLVDRPSAGDVNAENSPNGGLFDHRTEGLVVVNAFSLREAADHPAGLVTSEGPIGMEFVPENPLARHNVRARGARNKMPGVVVDECLVLIHHHSPPVGIGQGAAVIGW
jgi:hypothetical protein